MMFRKKDVKRQGFKVVYRAQGLLVAEVIRTKLEAADIPVWLDYESIGPTLGLTVDGLGEVQVLVPDEYTEAAERVIEVQGPASDDEIGEPEEDE